MFIPWQDLVNGSFEMFAGLLVWFNIRQIYLDKQIKGIHYIPIAVFTFLGFWNLYYYPFLDQWWSFTGGIIMTAMNAIWIAQILYYTRFAKTTK